MTKRLHYTVEDVIDQLSDEDDDYDDPDEPMMEGSDDEFSDLEMDERDYEDLYGPVNLGSPSSLAALPGSSTLSGGLPCSPTFSRTPHTTPSPQGSPSPDQSPSDTPSSSSTSPGKCTIIVTKYFITYLLSTLQELPHCPRLGRNGSHQ